MAIDLKIAVTADAADAVSDLRRLDPALGSVGDAARDAASDMTRSRRSMEDVASSADDLASASSQTAGGLGDLGGALSLLPGPLGKLGSGMEAAGPAIMGVTGAADLLNVATEKFPFLGRAAAKATNVLAVAKRALGVAIRFAMGPVGLIIGGLILLGTALFTAYKKSETFRAVCDAAFKAVGAAGRFLWNNVLQPVFAGIVRAIGKLLQAWGGMLRGLAKVPGFGWADAAGRKMQTAGDKAIGLADNMKKIPRNTRAGVTTPGLDAAIRKANTLAAAFTNAASAYLDAIGLGALSPGRVAGRTAARSLQVGPAPAAAPNVNVTVEGALDPYAVARQVIALLRQYGIITTGTTGAFQL